MCPVIQKRVAAVKTADAINAIEGAPISSYARALSTSWARWELTGQQMKQALLKYHRRVAEREHICRSSRPGFKSRIFNSKWPGIQLKQSILEPNSRPFLIVKNHWQRYHNHRNSIIKLLKETLYPRAALPPLRNQDTLLMDYHFLVFCIQIMFSFLCWGMTASPCLCKPFRKVFLTSRSNAAFCCPRCTNQNNVYKSRVKSNENAD